MCQLVLALVNQAVGGDKGHHLTQFLAGHFKRMLSGEAPFAAKLRVAQLAFGEEALGVLTVLNLAQAFAHRLAAFLVHNLRARVVLAVFGIVGDGVIHRGDATFVDEVHDELHFVAALKVSHFGGVTGFNEGRPVFARTPDAKFNLANFMRVNLFTSLGALKVGLDILMKEEHVQVDQILGHGGLFKTKGVGQKILAGAIDAPVSVMETAGEGGAWGIALLASYMINKEENETLEDYLDAKVFAGNAGTKMDPDPADVAGFEVFTERYKKGLPIERAAVESLK